MYDYNGSNLAVKDKDEYELLSQKHGLLEKALLSLSQESDYFKHGLLAAAQRIERASEANLENVRYLPSTDNDLFTLTKFASMLENVVQLEMANESIVQDNGIYKISSEIETSKVKQDEDFLSLVNSVLSLQP